MLAPAAVEADVRAAALAESAFGAGRPFRLFVYVTVGTGISSCPVVDGVPFTGTHGNALVMASGPLTSTCPECGNRFQSVLEDFASGPALVKRYDMCRPGQAESAEEVMSAAGDGDTVAVRVVESASEALGSSLAFLINVLDPEAVVVGGGLRLSAVCPFFRLDWVPMQD
ncbi:MAG TPA: ROK family protein [Terriglobia bacterium]|nr:ROK family protein [Terriglobia bacterium]